MERVEKEGRVVGYRLRSGRLVHTHSTIIGISDSSDVSVGYDGQLVEVSPDHYDEEERWTAEERLELAEEMIARWQQFKTRDALVVHQRANEDGSVTLSFTDHAGNKVPRPPGVDFGFGARIVHYE